LQTIHAYSIGLPEACIDTKRNHLAEGGPFPMPSHWSNSQLLVYVFWEPRRNISTINLKTQKNMYGKLNVPKKEQFMESKFLKDTAERAVRTFLQAYLASWVATGADYDGLVDSSNLKIGVTAVALSIAMSMGLKKVGPNKDSASAI